MVPQQVAAAQDERNRGEHVEPDRHRLAPALRIRHEVRTDEREPDDRRNEQRNCALHLWEAAQVSTRLIRKSTNVLIPAEPVIVASVSAATPVMMPAATMSFPTSWPFRLPS